MENGQSSHRSYDRLERALSRILGTGEITSKLSQVLAYTVVKGTVSYQETKEIIKDDQRRLSRMIQRMFYFWLTNGDCFCQ